MTVRSYGKNALEANTLIRKRIGELENILSVTMENSEVYKINHSGEKENILTPEVYSLLEFTLKGAEETGGAFNPFIYPVLEEWGFTTKEYKVPGKDEILKKMEITDFRKVRLLEENQDNGKKYKINKPAGMMMDFGAVGKGFAGDEALKIYREKGIKSAVIDLGGNVQVFGKKTDGSDWKIGLKNPWGGDVPLVLKASDCAVITSGGYERFFTGDDGKNYIHIFDGRNGEPVKTNLVSSTIVSASGLYGDYMSTAAFICGKDWTVKKYHENSDFDFILIFEDHSLCYSKGLENKIVILGDFSSVEIID